MSHLIVIYRINATDRPLHRLINIVCHLTQHAVAATAIQQLFIPHLHKYTILSSFRMHCGTSFFPVCFELILLFQLVVFFSISFIQPLFSAPYRMKTIVLWKIHIIKLMSILQCCVQVDIRYNLKCTISNCHSPIRPLGRMKITATATEKPQSNNSFSHFNMKLFAKV